MVAINQLSTLAASVVLLSLAAPQAGVEAAPALRAREPSASALAGAGRRMERLMLRSTSPPALPKNVVFGAPQTRRGRPATKRASAGSKRSNVHEHIHEHIHEHDHDHKHGHRHGKHSKDDKAHHSKHWAEHHGLAKREGEEEAKRDVITLGGDFVGYRPQAAHHTADDGLLQVLVGRSGEVELDARRHHRGGHSEHWWKHHKGDHKHEHDHEHTHEHIHEHIHSKREPRHRDHYRHGEHGDEHDHVHEHIHSHEHRRSAGISRETDGMAARAPSKSRPFRYHPRDVLAAEERGLIGDVVKPLLAPLNAIPGFVTISDLLFGDGGLVKKLGGLVLHAEPAGSARTLAAQSSASAYNYSLMASKGERTQVWLMATDANSTTVRSDATNATFAPSPSFTNDTTTVRVALPIVNDKGEPVLYCATFAKLPPSTLDLTPCAEDASESMPEAANAPTSQRFTYTASSGVLAPIYAAVPPTAASDDGASSSSSPASSASASSSVDAPASASSASASAPSSTATPVSYFRILTVNGSASALPAAAAATALPASNSSAAMGNDGKVSLRFVPAGAAAAAEFNAQASQDTQDTQDTSDDVSPAGADAATSATDEIGASSDDFPAPPASAVGAGSDDESQMDASDASSDAAATTGSVIDAANRKAAAAPDAAAAADPDTDGDSDMPATSTASASAAVASAAAEATAAPAAASTPVAAAASDPSALDAPTDEADVDEPSVPAAAAAAAAPARLTLANVNAEAQAEQQPQGCSCAPSRR